MSKFGDVLKALRKAHDLNLEETAKKLGTNKGYLSGIENDKLAPPSVKLLRKIAKLYTEVKLEDLAELAWAEKAPEEIRARVMKRIADNPLLKLRVVPAHVETGPEKEVG